MTVSQISGRQLHLAGQNRHAFQKNEYLIVLNINTNIKFILFFLFNSFFLFEILFSMATTTVLSLIRGVRQIFRAKTKLFFSRIFRIPMKILSFSDIYYESKSESTMSIVCLSRKMYYFLFMVTDYSWLLRVRNSVILEENTMYFLILRITFIHLYLCFLFYWPYYAHLRILLTTLFYRMNDIFWFGKCFLWRKIDFLSKISRFIKNSTD